MLSVQHQHDLQVSSSSAYVCITTYSPSFNPIRNSFSRRKKHWMLIVVVLICRVFFSPVSTFDPVICYVPSSSHRLDYQSNRGRNRLIVAFTRTPLTTWFEVIVVASTSFFSPVHLHPRWLLRSLLLPSPWLPIESNWIEVEEVDCCIYPPNPPSHLV